jgi:pilus assembly protein Flp/PilA
MRNAFLKLYVKTQALRNVLKDENGQDLVEYALVVGIIALGAVIAMTGLGNKIADAFNAVGNKLPTGS